MTDSTEEECERFDRIAAAARVGRGDLDFWVRHRRACPSGRHTDAGLERRAGLSIGTLERGNPSRGLLSRRARRRVLCFRLRYGAVPATILEATWLAWERLGRSGVRLSRIVAAPARAFAILALAALMPVALAYREFCPRPQMAIAGFAEEEVG